MTKRTIRGAHAATASKGSLAEARIVDATRNLSFGRGSKEDFEVFLVALVDNVGLYRSPSFAEYSKATGHPESFPLHAALHVARCEVVQIVLNRLNMSDEAVIALERAALAERAVKGR